jgi:hypothetical protein
MIRDGADISHDIESGGYQPLFSLLYITAISTTNSFKYTAATFTLLSGRVLLSGDQFYAERRSPAGWLLHDRIDSRAEFVDAARHRWVDPTATARTIMNYAQPWQENGYLILRNAFDPARIKSLREICESTFEQWKRESFKDGEPFGYCYEPKAWNLIHLNHPKYHTQQPERLAHLLDAVADPLVLKIIAQLFREDAVMMQCNLYIDPPGEGFIGSWHRDAQFFPGTDDAKERRDVAEEADPPRELHMHIPLVPTAATEVVPGSHRRWDSDEELQVRRNNPINGKMPAAMSIKLEPGDLAFFHVNSIHRGLYKLGVPRRTIAVTFGRAAHPRKATAEMMKAWRGYVATYQPWFLKADYLDGCANSTKTFFQRFVDVYRDSWKPEYLADLHPKLQEYFMMSDSRSERA